MMKFSMPGSPFQKIWQVYDPRFELAFENIARNCGNWPTRLADRDGLRDVLHEDASFELQLRLSVFGRGGPLREVLFRFI